jgi:hypothetical protein
MQDRMTPSEILAIFRSADLNNENRRPRRIPGPLTTRCSVKFMLLIYNDTTLLDSLPEPEFDARMRDCLTHADELRDEGRLLDSQQLEAPSTARTVRIRQGKQTTLDGPFAESKEVLGGFNLIEARDMEEAVKIAAEFPWARTGSVEVRPVRDLGMVRQKVKHPSAFKHSAETARQQTGSP